MNPVGSGGGLNAAQLQGGLVDPRVAAGDAMDPQMLKMNFAMGSPNPFRPIEDIQVAREAMAITCPSNICKNMSGEAAVYLHPVSQNEVGDILLACGNWSCGYEAVLRVGPPVRFEPRPGRPVDTFVAPVLQSQKQRKQPVMKKGKAVKQARATRATQPAKPAPQKAITLAAAATLLKVSLRTLRRAVRKGKLRALKRDGEYRVNPADLQAYQQEFD